ncbi:MAG: hypothetical protein ALECFALPRED_010932 [Alectoria fallacina]|uniref:Calcineurin-like phosphoesterase domain-containing protein n=1 Tax=Alectoria fallacina TaxID=1903189 RepID=A0A8H3PKB9_9LECA|nr:MAG: hypothetical protein ALECFALPRED_010932 [Alectoria fallacina]
MEAPRHPEAHIQLADSPPRYENFASGDEYPSEDELSDRDLHVLNTDYGLQRDLAFHPAFQPHSQQYNSSIPPRLPGNSSSADHIHALSDKYPSNTREWNGDSPVSPRTTLLHKKDMYNGSLRKNGYRSPQHDARAYQSYQRGRPLIELIRNEWNNNPYTPPSSSPGSPGYSSPNWVQVCSAPRVRRYVLLLLMLLSLTWGNWHYWAGPSWAEHRLLSQSLNERMKTGEGWFGDNMRPEFLDMVQVKTLDQNLIPAREDRKRLIVIGDVHGCSDELENLLAEVQYEARTDHLIFAGDFISKGPSSPAVIDLAMSAHASCVRGNHEDRVLLAYRDLYSHRLTQEQKGKKAPSPPAPGMPEDMRQNDSEDEGEELEEETFLHGDAVDRRLAESFTKRQIDYMASCPVILDIGQIKGLGDVHVVHAGLVPGVRLERQDPMGVMHMRTIDLDTHVPSSSAKGTPWFKLWNRYQSLIPSHQRSTVIYGHDSRRGLQIQKYSKGLDTGCVKGGKLSAMIIDNGVAAKEPKVKSVQCKDYRELEKRKEAKR